MGWREVAVVSFVSMLGSAARADEYPIEAVDRPNVMPAGMSTLGLYTSLGHERLMVDNGMGGYRIERSEFGEHVRLVLGYGHAFRAFELVAYASNDDGMIGARVALSPELVVALRIHGEAGTYANGESVYRIAESLRAGYRAVHVPTRFALYINGGVVVQQFRSRFDDGVFREGVQTSVDLGPYVTVQLAPSVSVWAGASVGALLYSSLGEKDVGVDATTGLQFSLRRWDFGIGMGISDATEIWRAYALAQIDVRWGI